MRPYLERAIRIAAVSAVVFVATLAVSTLTSFHFADHLAFDFCIKHGDTAAPSKQIYIVDFDEESVRRFGNPIPRSVLADVISKTGAAKPRIIGLNILLDHPADTPQEDVQLRDALTKAENIILASGSSIAHMPLPIFCQPEDPKSASGFCADGTVGALGYAPISLHADNDGVVRQIEIMEKGPPAIEYFSATMAQEFTSRAINPIDPKSFEFNGKTMSLTDAREGSGSAILIGKWREQPATRIAAWKVLDSTTSLRTLEDKLVLIGQSYEASESRLSTPLFDPLNKDNHLTVDSTTIQAAAITSLLEGNATTPASKRLLLFSIALLILIAAAILLSFSLGAGVANLVTLVALTLGLSLLLYLKLHLWLSFLPLETGLALTLPLTLGIRFFDERILFRNSELQRTQLMDLFSSYVDPSVAATLWTRRSELSLAGEEHIATVVFTDIRGFTALSAGQPPTVVLAWLNRYVIAMDEVIRAHGGFLNKFIGDGLMIIFGLPLNHGPKQDAIRAIEASLAMLARVELLNEERAADPDLPHLRIGIGIHTGSLVAGSIGSNYRQEYSVIGETVNLASRLESLNKKFGTEILISSSTMEMVVNDFTNLESLGPAEVAGLREPVEVFTLRTGTPGFQ